MDTKQKKYINSLLVALVLMAIALTYSLPIMSGDVWFHLNNGRWIVERGMLPGMDHFTFTASPEPSGRKTLILQSYWLSQALLYLSYKTAGFGGVVIAKAFTFTLAFVLLMLALRRGGLSALAGALVVAPLAVVLRVFDEARPHVLTFVMCIALFVVLESVVRGGRNKRVGSLVLLPVCMALWANLHPGYVIGMGMIGIYFGAETLRFITNKKSRDTKLYMRSALWLVAGILAAGLNPNYFTSVFWVFQELGNSPFVGMIDEYKPMLEYARFTSDNALILGMAGLLALTAPVLLLSWRRVRHEHALLYLGFGYAAYSSYRFGFFFALIAVAVAGQYVKSTIPERSMQYINRPWPARSVAAAVLLMALWVGGLALSAGTIFDGPLDTSNTPVRATATVRSSSLPPEIYNPYEWGGYMGWYLNPDYRVFIDARTIDLAAHMEYRLAKHGDLRVLDRRGVNTVVFYTLNPMRLGGGVPGVVLGLMKDPAWGLVFYDPISAVFVRHSALTRRTMMLGKELLWAQLEERLSYWAKISPNNYRPHAELGALYAAEGRNGLALESLGRSLALRPGNAEAQAVMNKYGLWGR